MSPRVEVIEMEEGESLLLLDEDTLDSSKQYRFVQERSANIARRLAQGYEVVLRSEHGVKLKTDGIAGEARADDMIRVADTILMQCDKTTYQQRRKRIAKLSHDRLGSTEKQFQETARKRGVRSLTGDEGEKR